MNVGTIGSKPCEIALSELLMEHADKKTTSKVTHLYQDVKSHLQKAMSYTGHDSAFYAFAMQLLREHHMRMVDLLGNDLPEQICTHLRCCIVTQHRVMLDQKNSLDKF